MVDDGEVEHDGIHGDLEEGLEAALGQSASGLCVPASAAMAANLVTGEELGEQDAMAAAVELGLLDGEAGAWEGMTSDEAVVLLEHMGVDATLEEGDLDDLRQHLDSGDAVIVSVDSDELWGEGEGGSQADHAIVIVAIDDERGVAIVNDPGVPGGEGVEVPLEVLEDAWEDSGNEMIVAEAGSGEGSGGSAPGPFETGRATVGGTGLVMLPVAVGAAIRRPRDQYPLFRSENVKGSYQPPR